MPEMEQPWITDIAKTTTVNPSTLPRIRVCGLFISLASQLGPLLVYAIFRTRRLLNRTRRLAKRSFTMYDTRILVLLELRINGDTSSVTAAIMSPSVAFLGSAIVIVIAS